MRTTVLQRQVGADKTHWEWTGLSTDEKPKLPGTNGSTFYEMDTNRYFVYNEAANMWILSSAGGGAINAMIMINKVDYYNDLPSEPAIGDTYVVKYQGTSGTIANNMVYTWYDNAWTPLSPDLSIYATKAELEDKQDKLTWDTAPEQGSTNPVTSDGIATALAAQSTLPTNAASVDANNVLQDDYTKARVQKALPILFNEIAIGTGTLTNVILNCNGAITNGFIYSTLLKDTNNVMAIVYMTINTTTWTIEYYCYPG